MSIISEKNFGSFILQKILNIIIFKFEETWQWPSEENKSWELKNLAIEEES